MASPAYRAPEHWGSPQAIPEDGSESPYQKAFNKVKHRIQLDILTWSSSIVVNTGMIFGGYDKLWRVCEGAAVAATGGTESLTGRVGSVTALRSGVMLIHRPC